MNLGGAMPKQRPVVAVSCGKTESDSGLSTGIVKSAHATILYLLGIDHERLTYRYRGRDDRLTDMHCVGPPGNVY